MTRDLDPLDVVDADLVDTRCAESVMPYCPGTTQPVSWMPDPCDTDLHNTHRLVYLHDDCAQQRALDA